MDRVSCRGCLLAGASADMHPLTWETRRLFSECTELEVGNDDPQHLCYHCHQQCKFWESFKLLCQKKDQFRKMQLQVPGTKLDRSDLAVQLEGDDSSGFQDTFDATSDADKTKEEDQIDFDSFSSSEDEDEKEENVSSMVLDVDSDDLSLAALTDTHVNEMEGLVDVGDREYLQHDELERAPDPFEGGIWRCPVCLACFSDYVYLREHIKEHHFTKKDPRCTICDEAFTSFPKVITHILSAHSTLWETYEEVGKSKTAPKDNRQECAICGEVLPGGSQLYQHMKNHHFAEKKQDPTCPLCKKHFNTVRGTIYHVIIKHNVSELETVLGDDIEDHRLGESEVPAARPAFRGFNISRFVECHLCDSFYCSFEEYQTHFATDHRSNSEESSGSNISLSLADIWPGDSSGRESTPPSSSSREATPPPPARPASKKNGRRQKQCHICGKFMLTSNIPYHTRRHKEVKSFRCDICLNFFKPVDMSRHRRLAETCKFCGKKFCGIRKMRQHVQEQHGSSSKHVFLKYSYK